MPVKTLSSFVWGFTLAVLSFSGILPAAEQSESADGQKPTKGYYKTEPLAGASQAGATGALVPKVQPPGGTTVAAIPMSTYSFVSTKDGKTYTGTMVGTSPFAVTKASATIPLVIVPVKITIGSSVFDPTAPNICDGNISAVNRFNQSPLVQVAPMTFKGVSMGTTQYLNAYRRAEFWNTIGGSAAYQNTLTPVTSAATVSVTAGTNGTVYSSGCTQLGIVSYAWLNSYITGTLLPKLTTAGVVSPSKFVVFLFRDIVESTSAPPTTAACCVLGFHGANGNPVQTWAAVDWDSTNIFAGISDATIASHELGEWMDDPLGTNATPAWGGIGQVAACQSNFENGDPLTGKQMPAITLTGKLYHMQELAYFSWFFNKLGVASVGAGGGFSSNGTFAGTSKVCPAGGTN